MHGWSQRSVTEESQRYVPRNPNPHQNQASYWFFISQARIGLKALKNTISKLKQALSSAVDVLPSRDKKKNLGSVNAYLGIICEEADNSSTRKRKLDAFLKSDDFVLPNQSPWGSGLNLVCRQVHALQIHIKTRHNLGIIDSLFHRLALEWKPEAHKTRHNNSGIIDSLILYFEAQKNAQKNCSCHSALF